MPHSFKSQERPGDARVLDCLYRVGAFVNATEDPREALDFILEEIVRTLGASSASIALVEPATGSLRIEVSNGLDAASTSEIIGQGQGITGWVALYAKPQRIPDVSKDPRYVEIRKGIRSELAVPMELMGHVIGVVNCDSDRLDAFTEQDVAFLSLLTNEASKAVGRIWLLRQLRSKAAQLEALVGAAQGLARERDEPGISLDLARHTRALLGARACAYFKLEGRDLILTSLDGDCAGSVFIPKLSVDVTSLGTVATRRRTLVVPIAGKTEENLFSKLIDPVASSSLLAVPVRYEDDTFGVLVCVAMGAYRFSDDDKHLVTALSSFGASSIQNARLYAKVFAVEEGLRRSERLTALGMLSAEVAHEIRNPLTVMKLLSDTLAQGMGSNDPRLEDLGVMREKISHMEGVVSRVLGMSKAQSGAFKSINLRESADKAVVLLRLKLQQLGVKFAVESEPKIPLVEGNPGQIQQVFLNLMLNAVQAMPTGGNLVVKVGVEPGPQGEVVVIRIADTGTGIAPEILPKIFESFFTSREDGTGLGLAIVKRIMRDHRGDIIVESTGPGGTTFKFWFPVGK
jgi:nitrogen-specific signal transduction histidine kinase/putative methionine-R-sulfoxide reductase with GAF domain